MTKPDYISRLVDYDDWMLNPEIFCMLDAMWGLILLIDLPICLTTSWHVSIHVSGTLAQKQWMHLPVIGLVKITGGARHCIWSLGFCDMLG